jgi:beta-lactamase regulating signal transducer with metallopeptidase domain
MNAIALAAGWLCTFAVHSTLLAFAVLAACLLLRRRAIGWQELLGRFALWGALCSSSVQWLLLGGPLGPVPEMVPALPLGVPDAGAGAIPAAAVESARSARLGDVPAPLSVDAVVCLIAAGFAALGLAWLLRTHLGLCRLLAHREPETDARVLAIAAIAARDLGLRTTPRLSRCAALPTPVAFGFVQPEVCLPARSAELDDDGLRAMLTHELAHLRRCDPGWLLAGAVLQALFPWQVLLVLVRRRLHQLGELRCDTEAAAATSPVAVARCLLSVADWVRPGAALPNGALAMAARPSALRERVEMALAGGAQAPVRRTTGVVLGAVCLAVLTAAAPGTRSRPAAADPAWPVPVVAGAVEDAPAPPFAGLPAGLLADYELLCAEVAALPAAAAGEDPELALLREALDGRLAALTRMLERLAAVMRRASAGRAPMDQGDRR